jgi:hypothetical protein
MSVSIFMSFSPDPAVPAVPGRSSSFDSTPFNFFDLKLSTRRRSPSFFGFALFALVPLIIARVPASFCASACLASFATSLRKADHMKMILSWLFIFAQHTTAKNSPWRIIA